jgi:putative oxidoreductase
MKILIHRNSSLIDAAVLVLRLMLGIWLFAHGAQKVFGVWGGKGMESVVTGMAKSGIPAWLAYLSSFTECFGGLLIAIGLLTRPAALLMLINMLVATGVMLSKGFFGIEDPFALSIIALAILLIGPGIWSIDHLLFASRGRLGTVDML